MTGDEELLSLGGLEAVSIKSTGRVAAHGKELVIVLLHGFDMTPQDLAPFAHSLGVSARFLFPAGPALAAQPTEPFRASGRGGRAWWHIDPEKRRASIKAGARDFAPLYPPDLDAARALLMRFLGEVVTLAEGRPIVLGGFSQGGMLVCDTIVRGPFRPAAAVFLSSSRIAFESWKPLLPQSNCSNLPVFISHGRTDADLAFSAGEALAQTLGEASAKVTWVPFAEGHEIPLVVWRRLRKFLQSL